MRPPRGRGGFRGGRDGGRGGGFRGGRDGGRGGGYRGGRDGGRGGRFGGRDEPPEQVVEVSTFVHACEGDAVTKLTNFERIPYFNAPIYLQNMTKIGSVDEIFGPINQSYFSVKMMEGIVATSYTTGDKFYIDPAKLLPLSRFTSQPKFAKSRTSSRPRKRISVRESDVDRLLRGQMQAGRGGGRGGGRDGGFRGRGRGRGPPRGRGGPRGGFRGRGRGRY